MKLLRAFIFVLSVAIAAPSLAGNYNGSYKVESDGYDVMMDLILRPVGLAATIIGAGVLVGTSPLTGMASIPSPHDAFGKLANTIVCKPFKWTFERPVGDYRYDVDCSRKVQPVAYRPAPRVKPPKPMIPEPPLELPKETNKKIDAIFKHEMMK